jgi:hypothetical protein
LTNAYRHAQGLIGALNLRQDEAGMPGAEDGWGNNHVKAV